MHEYRIFIDSLGKWINFVDRTVELSQLQELAENGHPFPIAIYGPEGCGKTALLHCFVEYLKSNDTYLAIYVDALELKDLSKAVLSTHSEVYDIIQSIITIRSGENIAESVTLILRKLCEHLSLRGKKIVVILDDVYRAIGLKNVVRYTKVLYEWIGALHREFNVSSVLFLLTTSEGVSKRELYKHTFVHVYMMWHLPREGLEDLAKQLDSNVDTDTLWSLTDGNPRALIDIASFRWNLDKWLRYVEQRIRTLIRDIDREKLRALVQDPDSDWRTAMLLEDKGLMIELNRATILGQEPDPDPELGIGKEWAWQLPIYRQILKKMLY